MSRIGHLHHLDFVGAAMDEVGAKVKIIGEENIPKETTIHYVVYHVGFFLFIYIKSIYIK